MSRRLGASLEFHIRHAQDILALEELGADASGKSGARPDGVSEDDWSKYGEVLTMASRQAADLLIEIRDRAIASLSATVLVTSKSMPRSTYSSWDTWFEFKLRGGGRKGPVGWIGALIGTAPIQGDLLIAYILPKGGEQRELQVLQTLRKRGIAVPDDVRRLVDGNAAPLCVVPLTPDADADELTASAVAAIEKVAPHVSLCAEVA